jgi:hypothetical protein
MGHGRGRTEHAGPRDTTRKDGHWGTTEEAKGWASRARRRAGEAAVREQLHDGEDPAGQAPPPGAGR